MTTHRNPNNSGSGPELKIGSTFTYAYHLTDVEGNPIPGTLDTIPTTLAAIESAYGKDQVYRYDSKNGSQYLAYGTDGDFYLYLPERPISGNGVTYIMPATWLRYPAGTQQPVEIRIWDSVQASGSIRVEESYTFTASYVGTGTAQVGSESSPTTILEGKLDYLTVVLDGGDTTFGISNASQMRIEYIADFGVPARNDAGAGFTLDKETRPLGGVFNKLVAYQKQ